MKHTILVKSDKKSYFQEVRLTVFFMTLYGQHLLTQYEVWNSKNYFRQTIILFNHVRELELWFFVLLVRNLEKKRGGFSQQPAPSNFFLLIKLRAFTEEGCCYFHCSQLNSDMKEFLELFASISFLSSLPRGWASRGVFRFWALSLGLGFSLGFGL